MQNSFHFGKVGSPGLEALLQEREKKNDQKGERRPNGSERQIE